MTKTGIALLCVAACIGLCVQTLRHAPTGRLEAWFLDVGQGDAILLQSPSGRRILVDTGPDRSVLAGLGRHLPLLDRSIDLLVITHADTDHSAGAADVLRRYRVGALLLPSPKGATPAYRAALAEAAARRVPVLFPDPGLDLRFDDGLTLDIVWPTPAGRRLDTNNAGIALRAMTHDRSVLLTGDMEKPAETALLKTGAPLGADVLKVAHHGSATSTATGMLLAVSPRKAVISAGRRNAYGHPSPAVLGRLRAAGVAVHVTGWEGEGEY